MVDSVAVITITYIYAKSAIPIQPGETVTHSLVILILSNYVYKIDLRKEFVKGGKSDEKIKD